MIARFLTRQRTRGAARGVPEGTRVYAVGDIHGRADLLSELHATIGADAARMPAPRNVLIHIGDYVDRGLQSRQVLDMLAGDVLPGFERADLNGTHDSWLLELLDDPAAGPGWTQQGGIEKRVSYG